MINLLLIFAFLQMPVPVRTIESAHITLQRPLSLDAPIARSYLDLLEQLYGLYSRRLQIGQSGHIRVRLCHDKFDFADMTGADSAFSPLWKDGTLYIIARDDISEAGYRTRLATGVVRGILGALRENGAPKWLTYSVAVYETGQYIGLPSPTIDNVKYFADLEEKMQSASSDEELSDLLFYLGNTGKFLDMKFGAGSLIRLLREFNHLTSFDRAVSDAYHVSSSQLERDWREYLRSLIAH